MKPYLICHMIASVDGRTSLRRWRPALDRLPSDEELCSQSTISRLENLPDVRALLRLGRALIEQYLSLIHI